MKEMYSKSEDCFDLSRKIMKGLGKKVDFYGTTFIETPSGRYLSSYRLNRGERLFRAKSLPFAFKYSKGEFLRVSIGENERGSSLGEKYAALSDFYLILSEEFGEPTFFYTIKGDREGRINLQWSFINKEEEIEALKNGVYFTDGETDELIIFGEKKELDDGSYQMQDETKMNIARRVGLPFELLALMDEDLEEYCKHKNGREVTVPEGARIDCVPVRSFDRKLSKRRN